MAITDSFAPNLFEGRTVLVTGGTSGIGLGCAQPFRDLGARVAGTGATEAECARAAGETSNAGIAFSVLDIRDASAVTDLLEGFEGLDVLVNAAGVIRRSRCPD